MGAPPGPLAGVLTPRGGAGKAGHSFPSPEAMQARLLHLYLHDASTSCGLLLCSCCFTILHIILPFELHKHSNLEHHFR